MVGLVVVVVAAGAAGGVCVVGAVAVFVVAITSVANQNVAGWFSNRGGYCFLQSMQLRVFDASIVAVDPHSRYGRSLHVQVLAKPLHISQNITRLIGSQRACVENFCWRIASAGDVNCCVGC